MRLPAHNLSSAPTALGAARRVVVSAWFFVFGVFALSGSGMRSASGLLLLTGCLMALAIIGLMDWSPRLASAPATRRHEGPFGSTDERDLVRMDSDKG
jgi:hypothetical protein